MTSYLGFDVLERRPNMREAVTDVSPRSLAIHDPGLGAREVQARDLAPAFQRSHLWTAQGLQAIADLRTWLAARRGRVVPFWVSTLRQDLILAAPANAADAALTIEASGYASFAYPHKARRHLAIHLPGVTLYRQVATATASAATESLALTSALGTSVPLGTLVSYLVLCRLDADDIELVWHTDQLVEAALTFREIPEEAP